MIKVNFDGACILREKGGYGFSISNEDFTIHKGFGKVIVSKENCTNNVAEHEALRQAFLWLLENELQDEEIKVFGDSKMVVNQIFGSWKAKGDKPYKPFYLENMKLKAKFSNIQGKWIPREENELADELSNLGLNS